MHLGLRGWSHLFAKVRAALAYPSRAKRSILAVKREPIFEKSTDVSAWTLIWPARLLETPDG